MADSQTPMSDNAIKLLRLIVESHKEGTYNGGVDTTEEWMLEAADELCGFMLPISAYPEHIECSNCDIAARWLATLDTTKPDDGGAEPSNPLWDLVVEGSAAVGLLGLAVQGTDAEQHYTKLADVYGRMRELATTTPSPNEAEAIKIGLCEGCEPITPHELHALYSLTGSHPAADEVVAAVRKKLSHTLGDLPEGAVSDEYKDYWMADHPAADIQPEEVVVLEGELQEAMRPGNIEFWCFDCPDDWTPPESWPPTDDFSIPVKVSIQPATQSIQAEAGGPEND